MRSGKYFVQNLGLKLFTALIEKGQGFIEAKAAAGMAVQSSYYYWIRSLWQDLFKKLKILVTPQETYRNIARIFIATIREINVVSKDVDKLKRMADDLEDTVRRIETELFIHFSDVL